MSCNCFSKCMLIGINVLFLILGAGLTAVGIWVIVSKNTMFDLLNALTKDTSADAATVSNYGSSTSTLLAAAYVAVAFGGLSIIVGFCGCIGAIKKNSCLLIIYAVVISVILLAEIAGAIAAAVFKSQINDQLKPRLVQLEKDHFLPYNLATKNNTSPDAVLTAGINYLQIWFECCGVTNQSDITSNGTLWYRSTRVYNGRPEVMPVTCCRMLPSRGDLLAKQDWGNVNNYLVDPNCPNTGNNSITTGCYTQVEGLLNTYSLPIIIVCASVGVFEIACVIMAACMIHRIRSKSGGEFV